MALPLDSISSVAPAPAFVGEEGLAPVAPGIGSAASKIESLEQPAPAVAPEAPVKGRCARFCSFLWSIPCGIVSKVASFFRWVGSLFTRSAPVVEAPKAEAPAAPVEEKPAAAPVAEEPAAAVENTTIVVE